MLLDRSFSIMPDHLSLVRAFQKPFSSHSPYQSRQLSYLTGFNCTFEYIAGQKNCKADCLPRLVVYNIFAQDNLNITLQEISKEQQRYIATNPDLFRFPNGPSICNGQIWNMAPKTAECWWMSRAINNESLSHQGMKI